MKGMKGRKKTFQRKRKQNENISNLIYIVKKNSSTLCLPQPRTNNLKKSFMYDGSFLWNSTYF